MFPPTMSEDSQELLDLHIKLSHISMHRLQRMAKIGQIPGRLSKCEIPLCQSCIYVKSTKINQQHEKIIKITAPGECISVDQLESLIPGLFGQMKGKLTKRDKKSLQFLWITPVIFRISICKHQQMGQKH